jgi:type II secretory pathway pseudopilin PulG
MLQIAIIGAAFAFGLVVLFSIIGRARNEGRLEERENVARNATERLGRAMEADAAARARDAAGGLLQDDGFKRRVQRVAPDHVV